jgi:hypothetical protein
MTFGTTGFRGQFGRAVGVGVLIAAMAQAIGCAQFVALGLLIGGFPSVQPDFDKMTKECLTDRGVKVAVTCFAPDEIRLNYTGLDKDISKYVANQLHQHKLVVVHPDQVLDWLDKHDDWDKPEEIGQATGATHIITIDVNKYSLFEENSHELFRGRAELMVSVYKMQKDGTAEKIYTKELTALFPLSVPRSSDEVSYDHFRQQYLSRLSEDVGRLFYSYANGDDITDVM